MIDEESLYLSIGQKINAEQSQMFALFQNQWEGFYLFLSK